MPAIEVQSNATLYVTNGTLAATGGVGDQGSTGVAGESRGGVGGRGGAGIAVDSDGALVFADMTAVTANGGAGGTGGTGGAAADGSAGSDGGQGGQGGNGTDNDGVLAADGGLPTSAAGTGGHGGEPGDPGEGMTGVAGADGADGHASVGTEAAVTLKANAATAPSNFAVYASGTIRGAAAVLDAAPVSWPRRTGYTLGGWYTAATGGSKVGVDTAIGDEGFETVYAHWTAIDNGSSGESSSSAPTSSTTTPTSPSTPVTTGTTPQSPTGSTPPSSSKSPVSTPTAPALPTTDSADLGVDDHTPAQGSAIVLTAYGFKPGTSVDFWMHSTPIYLGSAIANAQGVAKLPVRLDPSLAGVHHVQAVGVGPGGQPRNLSQTITIATAPAPALASTGFSTWQVTLFAVLLLAAGAGLLVVQRWGRQLLGGARHQ